MVKLHPMREDRSRILGDAVALCPACGFARRYLVETTAIDIADCPDCGAALLVECRACGEAIASSMQVDCRGCGEPLRSGDLFGRPVRRKPEGRRRAGQAVEECASTVDAATPDVDRR